MISLRAQLAVAAFAAVSVSSAAAAERPGISTIRVMYSTTLRDELCPTIVASFRVLFAEQPGRGPASTSYLILDVTGADELSGPGCSEDGVICAEAPVIGEDGKLEVEVVLDAGGLPEGVFGDWLDLSVSLISLDPDRDGCHLPGRSSVRIYTNCDSPPEAGDFFRRAGNGIYEILDVQPPACGFVPILAKQRTWGRVKAMYR